jgi:hypothetical protein
MRRHIENLGMVIDDYLDFKEFNNKDDLMEIIKNKKKQKKTDASLFEAKEALQKFRKDQFAMTTKIYQDYPQPIIWKPERFYIKRIQLAFPDP